MICKAHAVFCSFHPYFPHELCTSYCHLNYGKPVVSCCYLSLTLTPTFLKPLQEDDDVDAAADDQEKVEEEEEVRQG